MSKEEVLRTIGNKFFVWFLTLSLLIMGMTLIVIGDFDNVLSERIIGAVVISPLAIPLATVFKNKTDKQIQEYKLRTKELHNERIKMKQEYKLRKLEIKHHK